MNTVIKVENLGKKYIIRHQQRERYTALRDVMARNFKKIGKKLFSPFSGRHSSSTDSKEDFWALKDVSFEIRQGERVGIIGRNGAGKTTLLKLLSRITEPTTGRIELTGRVASLLEVGTGFHPELTGRENIYLNGAILGMSKTEIKKKFDEIVDFAEIEKFLDTPVKRYSSGMYVRLAFAVAAHLEPEILIVDEVLAVGDAQFQKKCIGKMEEVGKEGRTVLFVSHNMGAIQHLCQTCIYLKAGEIFSHDKVQAVLEIYQNSFDAGCNGAQEVIVKDGEARFIKWELKNTSQEMRQTCYSRDYCEFIITLRSKRNLTDAFIGFALWSMSRELLLAASSLDQGGNYLNIQEGTYEISIKTRLPIKAGAYQLDISLNSVDLGQLDRWSAFPRLNVLPIYHSNLPETWHGLVSEKIQFDSFYKIN